VVDDGSTDNTAEVVEMSGRNIKYVYQENKGPSAARNKGLEIAAGKYLAFLDADDLWDNNKLSRQIRIIAEKPEVSAVIGFTYKHPMSMDLDIAKTNAKEKGTFMLSLGASLFRKSVFKKVDSFDADMRSGEDIDWFLRAREAFVHIIIHKDVVQFYRIHGRNISNDQKLVNSSLLKLHKKSLDRRRKTGKGSAFKLPKLNKVEDVLKFWQSKD